MKEEVVKYSHFNFKRFFNFLGCFLAVIVFFVFGCSFIVPSDDSYIYSCVPNDDYYYNVGDDFLSFRMGFPSLDYIQSAPSKYYIFKSSDYIKNSNYGSLVKGSFNFTLENISSHAGVTDLTFPIVSVRTYGADWSDHGILTTFTAGWFITANSSLSPSSCFNYDSSTETYNIKFNSLLMEIDIDDSSPDRTLVTLIFYLVYNNYLSQKMFLGAFQYDLLDLSGLEYFSLDFKLSLNGRYVCDRTQVDPYSISNFNYVPFSNSIFINAPVYDSSHDPFLKFYVFKSGLLSNVGSNPTIVTGYDDGYHDGYQQGLSDGNSAVVDWTNLITTIISSPFIFLAPLSSFSIWGVNIYTILSFMFFMSVLLILFKVFR